jgi:4-amino-4-deoxy-L-arabinose transferase-like glycosyltransferase
MEHLHKPIAVDATIPVQTQRFSLTAAHCLRLLAIAAIVLLAYRIALMWLLPLADTTEARYGEIARLTLSNGFWLMPHIDVQTPFFAKPPLSTWVASSSMFLFGVNEFAARLPSLLVSFIAAMTAMAFASAFGIRKRWLVLPVLASCPLFFISAGAVMTDAVQMSVVTAALYFAWRAIDTRSMTAEDRAARLRWRLAFWTMVGIGALCKGLADWALIGLPLIAFAAVERRPLQMLRQLFDLGGVCIALCIFVPWYVAAEHYNPGFLNYFIVGEHFSRFLVPGWKGDRYGIAHLQPLGTIWIFWVASIFPWLGIFVSELIRFLSGKSKPTAPLERFLWCAVLMPLVFFTFAHNIIWTYGLTAIVPFSVLVARWLENASAKKFRIMAVTLAVFVIAAVLCAPSIVSNVNGNSERNLMKAFNQAAPAGTPLVYLTRPTYSSHFYAKDNLVYEPESGTASNLAAGVQSKFFVMDNKDIKSDDLQKMTVLFRGTRRTLLEEK